MTLILGVHLLERFYLVSDTRVTSERNDGKVVLKDNLIKDFVFNNKISAVTAGKALPASFILNRLRLRINKNSGISELKEVINTNLRSIISDFVNETGFDTGKVVFIIGGFDDEKGKYIEVSSLGNAMSSMVIAQGEVVNVNQSIDSRLLIAMSGIGGKKKGDHIFVKDIKKSEMFTVKLNIQTAEWKMEEVDCYNYVVFNPDKELKTVEMPEELMSILDFRERSGQRLEDQLYDEAELLINFVKTSITKHDFLEVGGHIFVSLQTPETNMFPTGDFAKVRDGNTVNAGSLSVEDGKIVYELEDGAVGKYRQIGTFLDEYYQEIDKSNTGNFML